MIRLTPRQQELVELVGGRGLSYARAAREMGLSIRTVEEYAAEIRALARIPASPKAALFIVYRQERETA